MLSYVYVLYTSPWTVSKIYIVIWRPSVGRERRLDELDDLQIYRRSISFSIHSHSIDKLI